MKYKLFKFNEFYTIQRVSDNTSFSQDIESRAYQQFVEDIYEQGIGIVEGADYVGVTTYTEARAAEYPPIVDQLDKIYHNGIDAWKADIKVIKDKYPKTQVGITSIAPIPDWVNTALFEKQKEKYVEAVARLAQYEVANGLLAADGISYEVAPLPIYKDGDRNPEVVRDEQERIAAQEVINKTPQAVIDSLSS